MQSKVSRQLEEAVSEYLVPLLEPVGLLPIPYPERISVGLVARALGRELENGDTLLLAVWCDGGTAHNLRWRLDVYDGRGYQDLALTFPFEVVGSPPARPTGATHSIEDFRAHASEAHFRRSIEFLGCLIVAHHREIVAQVPELGEQVQAALRTDRWVKALREGPELWARRLVEGDIDAREEWGKVVFVGEQLLVVAIGAKRLTFKLPTRGITKGQQAGLSDWWTNPAGTEAALKLRVEQSEWRFDFFGRLVS